MRLASLLAAAGLGLAACAPSSFTTEVKGETSVPAGPPGGDTSLNAFPSISSFAGLDFNQNQDFKNQGVDKGDVTSVKVKSVTLKVLSPNDQGFGFLSVAEFFARAGDREARIAQRQDISRLNLPSSNPVLSLDVDNVELQPFVSAPTMSIIVRGRGVLPEREVRLQAVVTLEVEGGLL
ncbi:hypothetical protein ACLESD_52270 [Pyxidicoccus sp. 3LFB2]